jgi:hypothetical protein
MNRGEIWTVAGGGAADARKLTTVPRARLGRRIGILDDALRVRMNRSILVFLGLAR